jgi:vitamin B12 transporter
MKRFTLVGLAGLATTCAHAQVASLPLARTLEPVVVTATRAIAETPPTLRDAVTITREELEAAGPITLAEVLQRHAGVEVRANGGPGQTSGLFLRGAGPAQTLVLVDGLRVGSATSGGTAIEAIPLELIERIEVVKGPMSGLYGSDAIGGVVQVFTRGKSVPHLFGSVSYGTDNDRRVATGIATADDKNTVSLSAGWRKVDARSAANPRASFGYDPDRDPHENTFATLHAAHKLWNGEVLQLDVFGSRAKTFYDAGDPADRSTQELAGARVSSTTEMYPWWKLKLAGGHSLDRQRSEGGFASFFETRQDQAAFINDFRTATGNAILGVELLRQEVSPLADGGATIFARDRRDTDSVFASVNESVQGHRFEANVRRDHDPQYGARNTGAVSYGALLARGILATVTVGRGFRVPSFNDLYLVQFEPFYKPNPALLPERSRSTELSLKSLGSGALQWRLTAFDNRIEDLVTLTADSVINLDRARIRGLELVADLVWLGAHWRLNTTAQRPRDEATGTQLRQRAERFGSLDASRAWGAFTAGMTVVASSARYDANDAAASAKLGGYARVDARLRWKASKHWAVELTAVNLGDKRYENALGYDAPRRGALLSMRFDAF